MSATLENRTQPLGLLAEFHRPEELLKAARDLREAGYRELEAFSPFPIHGIDEALAIRRSPLAWFALAAGVLGGAGALLGQWWTNAVDYPYLISGKPLFSLPANIPITFEVIILCSAFAAFLGFLGLNKLPRLANPLLRCARFSRASSDRFYLLVEAGDARFVEGQTTVDLRSIGARHVECLRGDGARAVIPRVLWISLAVLATAAAIPPLWITRSRATTSEKPPLRSFRDMDFQPKFKAQTESPLFADRRSMRPAIPGTVARGELRDNDALYRGVERATQGDPPWTDRIPVPISDELMRRGREGFNIYCATCHGRAGDGNGPVSVRALELEQGTWVPPTSIHADHVREQPVGQLFHTITHGVRKMPGYASQIEPEDRWAIVLYLRALQRSRRATSGDLSTEELRGLRDLE